MLIVWALIIATVYVGNSLYSHLFLTSDSPRAVSPRGDLAVYERSTMEIFDTAAPSVVYIFTETSVRGFFGTERTQQGTGSGFLWDKAGHVVTNFHVIANSRRIQVKLDSGSVVDASFVGASPEHDLAVIRLRNLPSRIMPIPVGTSADLRVGQSAFAIGNPFGFDRTLTSGIISAVNRRLPTSTGRDMVGLIQTDAAINPGNSGGPLLDSAGRLIGVNTAIISESGSSAGIGFAVPVDTVNTIVPVLIRDGKVPRPGIGISALPDEDAARLGIPGIVIAKVLPGSEADKAGLSGIDYRNQTLGDVIVEVEGRSVADMAEFLRLIQDKAVGDSLTLTVERDGVRREVKVLVMDIS